MLFGWHMAVLALALCKAHPMRHGLGGDFSTKVSAYASDLRLPGPMYSLMEKPGNKGNEHFSDVFQDVASLLEAAAAPGIRIIAYFSRNEQPAGQ